MSETPDALHLEPADLDGHTIEELSDYLDRGREPADRSIDDSPACRMALAALERLSEIAVGYLDAADAEPSTDEDWIGRVLAVLPLELRRGRLFPVPTGDPDLDAQITEGALRGFVRAIGDAVPGLLIGAVEIRTAAEPGDATDLGIDVALLHGTVLQVAEQALRDRLRIALARHAPFVIGRIDIRVVDLITPRVPIGPGSSDE